MEILVKSFKESYDDDVRYNEEVFSKVEHFQYELEQSMNKLKNSIYYGTGNVRDHADSLEETAKKLIELSKKFKNQEE